MIKTHGLTHLNLAVKDPDRALKFYQQVFGVKEYYRDENSIQVQGPGPYDVMAFERDARAAGKAGGVTHFGFRLTTPGDIEKAVKEVKHAGGKNCARASSPRAFPLSTSPIRMVMRLRFGLSDIKPSSTLTSS